MLISCYQTHLLCGCVFSRLSEDEYLALIIPTNGASVRSDWDYSGISHISCIGFATSWLVHVSANSFFLFLTGRTLLIMFKGAARSSLHTVWSKLRTSLWSASNPCEVWPPDITVGLTNALVKGGDLDSSKLCASRTNACGCAHPARKRWTPLEPGLLKRRKWTCVTLCRGKAAPLRFNGHIWDLAAGKKEGTDLKACLQELFGLSF